MKNLTGNQNCDAFIARELSDARIAIESVDLAKHSGVPYRLIGQLGPITFRRCWTYWVAEGPVPIGIARSLYADPVGRRDVRVDGHCACPAPVQPWTEIIDGTEFVTTYHIDSENGLRIFADAIRAMDNAVGQLRATSNDNSRV